jgi:hypothetical protein
MTVRFFIHSIAKRAETIALVDSGATENFMNLTYAKWLRLPIKRLSEPRKLFNVDGTENKSGELQFYADLQVRTGTNSTTLRFFLTELGEHKAILGYPWFAATQPKIDWKRGWIDHTQLPIILRTDDAKKATFVPRNRNVPRITHKDRYFIGRVTFLPPRLNEPLPKEVPKEYERHKKVFDEEKSQRLPQHTIWDHAIELAPEAPRTLPGRLLPLTQEEIAEVHKFVAEHLKRGTIRESWSPYAANFFFVKKKDGKLRPVQDYRPLNKWTKKNRNVSPLIPQTIDRLGGCTLFTKFDVRWGYNNIRIKKGDEWKAAFLTPEGLFEPTVMFFGLTNSPATFQMMMNTIFRKEVAQGWLSVYMDDIAIHTKPLPTETEGQHRTRHRRLTHHVLDRLEENDLYLKPEKCAFEQKEIDYLGVIVGRNSLRMDPKKLKGVADWPIPRNPTEIRQFLGFTGYYRYFVPNYSKIARPLLDLTKKTTEWKWGESQHKAFEELKTRMCCSPVLTQPDFDRKFYLQTDASAYGVGAVLSQEGGPSSLTLAKRHKPVLHPNAYYSATFTPTERNYDIYERELLAVMKSLAHWRQYLGWTKEPFTILSDHANLQYWKSPRNLNRRTARWHADLQEYDYEIKHVPGKTNIPADALSRPPGVDQGTEDNQNVVVIPSDKFAINKANVQRLSELDKRLLMALIHDHPTAGHPGRDETIHKAKQHKQWDGMNRWIASYVKGCATCQQNKIQTHRKKVPLFRITTKEGALPFQQIAMDLITGLPPCNGKDAILTIVDHGCSRAAVFLPCSMTITGPGIADLYLNNVYRWFGLPTKMISDRDPRFTSHFGKALCQKLGIQQNLSSAFHPQTDGISERKNQWVEQYLRLVTSNAPEDWAQSLSIATAVHNNRVNSTTGLSPNQILLGYETTLHPSETQPSNNEAAQRRSELLKRKREQAIDAINKTAKTHEAIPPQFRVGDQVWLEASNLKLHHQKTKLAPKRYGPFRVIKEISPVAYRIQLPTSWGIHNVFHASLLSPYHETTAHGPNYSRPPPDLIDGEEEYEVERIINHRRHGRSRVLQYFVKWKGYPESDNTWEPADQVHAPELLKGYHRKNPLNSIKGRRSHLQEACPIPHFASENSSSNRDSLILSSLTALPKTYHPTLVPCQSSKEIPSLTSSPANPSTTSPSSTSTSSPSRTASSISTSAETIPAHSTLLTKECPITVSTCLPSPQPPAVRGAPPSALPPSRPIPSIINYPTPRSTSMPSPSEASPGAWSPPSGPACSTKEPNETDSSAASMNSATVSPLWRTTSTQPPEGYVENTTQAPGFYIPTKNGLSRPAKWVKQLEDGRVAGFSPEDGPTDSPFITDLYANPAYEYDEPQVPFPCWIREMLRGPSPVFNTLRDAIAAKGDWALLAEVIRYREYEDNVQMLSARAESINKDLDAVLVSQRLCEGRMEAARLDKQVSELQGFVHRFPEDLGHREGRRYWKQLGRRGRGRPS